MKYPRKKVPLLEGSNDGKHWVKIPCSFGDRWRMMAAARQMTRTEMYEWLVRANNRKALSQYRVIFEPPATRLPWPEFNLSYDAWKAFDIKYGIGES